MEEDAKSIFGDTDNIERIIPSYSSFAKAGVKSYDGMRTDMGFVQLLHKTGNFKESQRRIHDNILPMHVRAVQLNR